jgi:hypothetical protein
VTLKPDDPMIPEENRTFKHLQRFGQFQPFLAIFVALLALTFYALGPYLHRVLWITPEWIETITVVLVWLSLVGCGVVWLLSIPLWWNKCNPPGEPVHLSVVKIDAAFQECDSLANDEAHKRNLYASIAACLSPVAVGALAAQVIYKPDLLESYGLIGCELIAILLALWTVYHRWPIGTAHETWIPARLRTELLRREEFLYRARLGPYLNCTHMQERVNARLEEIHRTSSAWSTAGVAGAEKARLSRKQRLSLVEEERKHLAELLGLEHRATQEDADRNLKIKVGKLIYWRHDLEAQHGAPPEAGLQLEVGLQEAYVERRLLDQRDTYYARKKMKHEILDRAYESMAGLGLGLAAIVAGLHLLMLNKGAGELTDITALVLPPIGVSFLALRTYFENHRLSRSYEDLVRQLTSLKEEFEELDKNDKDYDHDLKSLILKTETMLSHEVRRWWLIVWPEPPKA